MHNSYPVAGQFAQSKKKIVGEIRTYLFIIFYSKEIKSYI